MEEQSIKLLSILSSCSPDDLILSRATLMASITHSKDYITLKNRQSYHRVFEDVFALDKLNSYSVEQLKQLREALPSVGEFLQNLIYSLSNGDCPQLTEKDRPSFFDKGELDRLIERLEDGNGKNFCNIPADECMDVFNSSTIKNAGEIFLQLPEKCEDYSSAIKEMLNGKKYCISQHEIVSYEEEYKQLLSAISAKSEKTKRDLFKFKLAKTIICLIFMLIPWSYGRVTGNLSHTSIALCTIGMLLTSIVCWIKGKSL